MIKYILILALLPIYANAMTRAEYFKYRKLNEMYKVYQESKSKINKEKLEGLGTIFHGELIIEKDTKDKTKLLFKSHNRNCGVIKLPNKKGIKEEDKNKRIKLRFKKYRSCEVQSWEILQ